MLFYSGAYKKIVNYRYMKKLAIILSLTFFIFGCEKEEQQKKAAAPRPENAIAKVGEHYITETDLENQIKINDGSYRKFLRSNFGKDSLLSVMVREALIHKDAAATDVAQSNEYKKIISDAERDLALQLEQIKERALIDAWYSTLKEKGITAVTDEEIAAYHKKYPYEISMRVMTTAKADDASAIVRELRAVSSSNKEKRFNELAKMFSTAPNSDVISFIPGEFLPEIENAAANSPSSSVQGFFKTARGFTIIYKKNEQKISLKDAKERIRVILEQKKLDAYLQEISSKYNVEVYKIYEN